jgi:hypothetical protein
VRTGIFKKGWLIIDEIGQIGVSLLAELACLLMSDQVHCIVMGDENQFAAIDMLWRGCEVKRDIWSSSLLHTMGGGNCLTLKRYRRGDDPALFDFYSQINEGLAYMSLQELVCECQKRFPKKEGDAVYNLVISHKSRVDLNKELNEKSFEEYRALNPEGPYAEIAAPETSKGKNQPQDFFMFPGQILIGCTDNTNTGIFNGAFYEVISFTGRAAILKDMDVGGEITVDAKTIERFLRLSHAMVYAQVQGRTFRKALVRLWDTDHRHFTRRHLLVGVSRATAGIYVDIA